MKFEIEGKDVLKKTVKRHSKSTNVGHIYLPEEWVGKEVLIILEPKD